jgi:hypothetical protein
MRTGKKGVKKQVTPEGERARKRDAEGLTKGQRHYRKQKLQKQQ